MSTSQGFAQSGNVTTNDQMLIAQAIARKQTTIEYQLLTTPASTMALAADVRRLGGHVQFEADELGYIHAVVPISQLGRLAALPEIQTMNVLPAEGNPELEGITPSLPSSSTPYDNAFTGVNDVGAPAFIRQHPTFDGRGVTIGFIELFDPTHPALQSARTLSGEPVPKVVDFRVCCGKFESMDTPTWYAGVVSIQMQHVQANAGTFSYLGHTYTAPYDGTFQVGMYHARGYTNVSSGSRTQFLGSTDFPILWDIRTGNVWVDTAQTGSFANVRPMRDFHVKHDIGMLPLMSSEEKKGWPKMVALPSSMPFVVQTDANAHQVTLILPWEKTHGTMTTTSAAGNGFWGGAAGGVAPNARIISVSSLGEDVEAMIELARMHVDIISLSGGVFAPGYLRKAVDTAVVKRLIDRYGIVVVSAAQNEGFMQSADSPENNSDNVIVIGGYTSSSVYGGTIGVHVSMRDDVVHYSSGGPRYDGMLQPDVVSPTGWVAGTSQYVPPGYLDGTTLLPVGYEIGGGTSQATPTAAGAIALLLSAAKQEGIHYTPELVKRVVDASARYLPGIAAYRQGNGLIDVPAAWAMLRRTVHDTSVIAFSAPVRTADSGKPWQPSLSGEGLYEREGWQAGMRGVRVVRFIRTSGPSGSIRYAIRLVGNDGTFTPAVQSIVLPLNRSVPLAIAIAPAATGAHSAILRLVNEQTGEVVSDRMLTIVAAAQFTRANAYHVSVSGSVTQPDSFVYFVHVPPNTDALTIRLRLPQKAIPEMVHNFAAQWDIMVAHLPNGRETRGGWPQFTMYHENRLWQHTFWRPMPGVWELQFDSARLGFWFPPVNERLSPVPFQLSASVYHVVTLQHVRVSRNTVQYTLRNAFAPFHLRSAIVQSASHQSSEATLSPANPQAEIPVMIPKSTAELRVYMTSTSQPSATVAVHVFNCARVQTHYRFGQTGQCTLRAESDKYRSDSEATTAIPIGSFSEEPTPPTPGQWRVAFTSGARLVTPLVVRYKIVIISQNQHVHPTRGEVPMGAIWSERFTLPGACAMPNAMLFAQLQAAEIGTIIRSTPFPADRSGLPTVIYRENPSTKPVWIYSPVWESTSDLSCPR